MEVHTFNIGDIIEGTVTELRKFGALMIFEHDAKGLLHISELSDRFVFDLSKYVQVGRNYNVKILEIDPANGFLKVSLRKVTMEDRLDLKTGDKKRFLPDETDIDFSPLRVQLEEWTKKEIGKVEEEKPDVEN